MDVGAVQTIVISFELVRGWLFKTIGTEGTVRITAPFPAAD